jgi:CRP/FNR family transcriptional regulator, cyclic AMP receptor protein
MRAATSRPWPSNAASRVKGEHHQAVDAQAFLGSAGMVWEIARYGSDVAVFTQGEPATSVLFIQEGGVKVTVVNKVGKEAVVAILGPGDFLGEGCLAGQISRVNTATTITAGRILVIERSEMIRLLHAEPAFSDRFIKHLLARKIRVEDDLIDQLFNHSEKRLARTLLLLVAYGKQNTPERMVPNISQEVLAEMVGTTRSRVNLFMNGFRKRGFIEYGGRLRGLQINKSLQDAVLQD